LDQNGKTAKGFEDFDFVMQYYSDWDITIAFFILLQWNICLPSVR